MFSGVMGDSPGLGARLGTRAALCSGSRRWSGIISASSLVVRASFLVLLAPLIVVPAIVGGVSAVSPARSAERTAPGVVGKASETSQIRDNWPCAGCVVVVPASYNPRVPSAILVALHGDEGVSSLIASAWAPIAAKRNVILFAPECPTDEGCRLANGSAGSTNSWWGWLQYSGRYDDAWIGRQVGKISASYTLDRSREYLTGWSGGADFLGWYALRHADQFAAVAFVAGGVPYYPACPARRLAGYFLMGSADFRYASGQPSEVRGLLRHCGDPTRLVVLAGAEHEATAAAIMERGYGNRILTWMLAHPLRR